MKVSHRQALKAAAARETRDQKAQQRENAFREIERARRAVNDAKTARLKALRLAVPVTGAKEPVRAGRK